MAAEKIHIEVGGQDITLPAWATKEQFSELQKLDASILKTLSEMLKQQMLDARGGTPAQKQQVKDNKDLVDAVIASDIHRKAEANAAQTKRDNAEAAERQRERDRRQKRVDELRKQIRSFKDLGDINKLGHAANKKWSEKQLQASLKAAQWQRQGGKMTVDAIQSSTQNLGKSLGKAGQDMSKAAMDNKLDLKALATGVGSVFGLGTAFGLAAGVVEGFAKNITQLSRAGIGLSTGLDNLRTDAANAGLNLEQYGKILLSNTPAILAFGTTMDEGASSFSRLSRQLRHSSRALGQFGLNNEEYNQILLEEMDIRRVQGMDRETATRDLTSTMNDMLLSTNKLAAATGQNTLELIQQTQAFRKDDRVAAMEAAITAQGGSVAGLTDTFGFLQRVFGEDAAQLTQAMEMSRRGEGFEQYLDPEMLKNIQASPELGELIYQFRDFYTNNSQTLSADDLNAGLADIVATNVSSLSTDRRMDVAGLSLNRYSGLLGDSSTAFLKTLSNMQGMLSSEETTTARKTQEAGLGERRGMLTASASLDEAVNQIKSKLLETFIGDGDSLESGLNIMVDKLNEFNADLSQSFGVGGLINSLGGVSSALGVLAGIYTIQMIPAIASLVSALAINRAANRLGGTGAPVGSGGTGAPGGAGGGSKLASRLAKGGGIAAALVGAYHIYDTVTDETIDDRIQDTQVADAVGATAGGAGGAWAGATGGAALGTMILPGPGTAIGGILGGLLGGTVGSMGGGWLASGMFTGVTGDDITGQSSREDKAAILYNATAGAGTDQDAIQRVMKTVKTKEELEKLKETYRQMTGQGLIEDLKDDLSDTDYKLYFEDFAMRLQDENERKEYAVQRLHEAMDGIGTDEESLKSVMAGIQSADEFKAIAEQYKEKHGSDLMETLRDELSSGELVEIMPTFQSSPGVGIGSVLDKYNNSSNEMNVENSSSLNAVELAGQSITEINGQVVPMELLNEFEKEQLKQWAQVQESMGTDGLQKTTQELRDLILSGDERLIEIQLQVIAELREQNRLARKQLKVAEDY